MLPRNTSNTPAAGGRHHDEIGRNQLRGGEDLRDGLALAAHPRESPPCPVLGSHARHVGLGSHVKQRDRRLAVAADVGRTSRELDGRARVWRVIDRDQHVVERECAVGQRDEASLGVGGHEQGHRSRTPRHRLGHRTVQPSRGAVASLGRNDQQIGRSLVEVIDDGPRGKKARDRALGNLHAESFEERTARAVTLEQTPAFEGSAHGRKIAPVRPIVGGYVQDDEPRATHQRNGERMRECALAGRREVRWMNDLLDEWWNGVSGLRR